LNILAKLAKVDNIERKMDRLVDGLVPQLWFTMAIFAEQLNYDKLVKRYIKFEHKFLQKFGTALDFHQNSGFFPVLPAFSVPVPYMAHPITGPLQMLPALPGILAASQISNSAPGGTSSKIRVPSETEKANFLLEWSGYGGNKTIKFHGTEHGK
jgi:hypothetical protein